MQGVPVQHDRHHTHLDDNDATAMDVSLEELHTDEEGRTTALNGADENNLDMEDEEIFDDDTEDGELEEEWSEDDDRPTQYDLRQYGVYQSLPIPPGPPDMQSDCDTAEEYIKRVRYGLIGTDRQLPDLPVSAAYSVNVTTLYS